MCVRVCARALNSNVLHGTAQLLTIYTDIVYASSRTIQQLYDFSVIMPMEASYYGCVHVSDFIGDNPMPRIPMGHM